jgi:uncharacterized protein
MKHRVPDPLRLDVAAFTADAGALDGVWPGVDLTRLSESQTLPQDATAAPVQWRLQGERVATSVGDPEQWLHLSASTTVWLTCQRCLQPLAEALAVDRRLRFVRDEAQAEALDAESEDDVLAMPRWLDARELIEDELLLALPLVPRHDQCPQALPMSVEADVGPDEGIEERPNPFAVLKSLKPGKG